MSVISTSSFEEASQLLRVIMEQKVSVHARTRAAIGLARDSGHDFVIEQLVKLLGEWQDAYEKRMTVFDGP